MHKNEVVLENEEIVESEESNGDEISVKPWDPMKIRITTKNFSIREIYTQIGEGELDLAPDFQRAFVWRPKQQIRLIESILLGIPLPAFYFNQDKLGELQVIDGVQRLTTIRLFMSDNLILDAKHLEYLSPVEGLTYSTLDAATRRRFAATQIVAHVIEPQTPSIVKYDIFNRVNTGGSPLVAQEIRHCMSKTRSRNFLKLLIEKESFDKATNYTFWANDPEGNFSRNNRRMADREMALRFCAFRSVSLEEYSKAGSLDAFLLNFTNKIDEPSQNITKEQLQELELFFDRAMVNSFEILDNLAFRRWRSDTTRRGPLNRAIFESQALALADYTLESLMPYKETLTAGFKDLFLDAEYESSVRSGTGAVRNVDIRLRKAREFVGKIIK